MNPAINVHRGAAAPNQKSARTVAKDASSVEEVQAYEENFTEASVTTGTAKWVYILSLAGFIVPFTGIIGLIMAYMNRADAPAWLASHYQFQIRTFWIGLLYTTVALLLTAVAIGFVLLFAVAAWLLIRYIKGLSLLNRKEAHPNPTTWLF
jgi:uncharacterized membrane protein